MSPRMTPHQYREFVDALFVKRRRGIEGFLHGAVGLSGEAGEVLDLVKKSWAYDKPLDLDKLQEECGDVFHYLNMVCIKAGWTLDDLIANNVTKLRKRYPNGYTDAAAIARADKHVNLEQGRTPNPPAPDGRKLDRKGRTRKGTDKRHGVPEQRKGRRHRTAYSL